MDIWLIIYIVGAVLTFLILQIMNKVDPFHHKYEKYILIIVYVIFLLIWPLMITAAIIKIIFEAIKDSFK